jgi:hypothetical protein
MRTSEQNNANPIGDKVDPNKKPETVQSREVRPPTLPKIKKSSGITMVGDFYDDKFGRA